MTSKLKEAREKAGYTIEEVSEILKIRKKYIMDIEEGTLEDMPGKVYIKGYTNAYHEFLGLKRPKDEVITVKVPEIDDSSNHVHKKYIVIISIISLVLVVSLYVFMNLCHDNESIDNIIDNNDHNETTTN